MRCTQALKILSISLVVSSGSFATIANAAPSPLIFPVVVEASTLPEKQTITGKQSQYPLVVQKVRFSGAARVNQPIELVYKSPTLDRKMFSGGELPLTIAADTVFVAAQTEAGEIYCATAAPKIQGDLTNYDAAICLRDQDRDGEFDGQLFWAAAGARARAPYEILLPADVDWTPVEIPYARLTPAETPSAQLEFTFSYFPATLLRGSVATANMTIRWERFSGGLNTRPSTDKRQMRMPDAYYVMKAKKGVPEPVSWNPISVEFTAGDNSAMETKVLSTYPPGRYLMFMSGWLKLSTNYNDQTSLFSLKPISPLSDQQVAK